MLSDDVSEARRVPPTECPDTMCSISRLSESRISSSLFIIITASKFYHEVYTQLRGWHRPRSAGAGSTPARHQALLTSCIINEIQSTQRDPSLLAWLETEIECTDPPILRPSNRLP